MFSFTEYATTVDETEITVAPDVTIVVRELKDLDSYTINDFFILSSPKKHPVGKLDGIM